MRKSKVTLIAFPPLRATLFPTPTTRTRSRSSSPRSRLAVAPICETEGGRAVLAGRDVINDRVVSFMVVS